jgi:glycosyltransferase involved in cell wall biosynthesis
MTKISIIIPLFNAENYLQECLESVRNQTFHDWECIIVDDGSTDKSAQIAIEFVNADKRFKMFSIEHSGNPQNVRHFARLNATGDWLLDLDADDFLAPNCLEKLIERQKQTNADVVLLQLYLFDNETGQILQKIPTTTFDFAQLYSGNQAVMLTVGQWEIPSNGLFRKDLYNLQENYSNNLLNLDEYAQRVVLFNAKTVAFSDAGYFYRQHDKSLTKHISERYFYTIHSDKLLEEFIISKFGKHSKEATKAKNATIKRLLNLYVYFFQVKNHFSKDEQKHIKTLFLEHLKNLSAKDIWNNDLHIFKKCVLTLPAIAISCIACLYARYK